MQCWDSLGIETSSVELRPPSGEGLPAGGASPAPHTTRGFATASTTTGLYDCSEADRTRPDVVRCAAVAANRGGHLRLVSGSASKATAGACLFGLGSGLIDLLRDCLFGGECDGFGLEFHCEREKIGDSRIMLIEDCAG